MEDKERKTPIDFGVKRSKVKVKLTCQQRGPLWLCQFSSMPYFLPFQVQLPAVHSRTELPGHADEGPGRDRGGVARTDDERPNLHATHIITCPIFCLFRFNFLPYTVELNYQDTLMKAREEIAVVWLGPIKNDLIRTLLVLLFHALFSADSGSISCRTRWSWTTRTRWWRPGRRSRWCGSDRWWTS